MDAYKTGIQVILINFFIGFFINAIGFTQGLATNLIFSQCVGLSIFAFVQATLLFSKDFSVLVKFVFINIAILSGTCIGFMLANLITGQNELGKYFFEKWEEVFFSLVAGIVVSNYFIARISLQDAQNKTQKEKLLRLAQEKSTLQAEFKILQAQIEPHFLVNTLSNIHSLMLVDVEMAESMLLSLTDFLHLTLSRIQKTNIPLSEELAISQAYLDIQQIRMGKRLQFHFKVDKQANDYSIPPMLIQPLVENSIKHGLEPMVNGGELSVEVVLLENKMCIKVIDNGCGFNNCCSPGIGLSNIKERLQIMYGRSAQLLLEENDPQGVTAIVDIPL